MKKLLVLSLALCLLLGGCGSNESDPAGASASSPLSPAPDVSSASESNAAPAAKAVRFESSYLSGGSGNEAGYYHIVEAESKDGADAAYSNIFYIDYATKQEIYLCNKPNCKHNDETCSSYLEGSAELDYNLLATDSALYLLYTPAYGMFASIGNDGAKPEEKAPTPAIYRMQPDGTGRSKVLELESGLELSGPYIYGGGKLYCNGAKTKMKDQGNGMFAAESGKRDLLEFDLENQTTRVVTGIAYDQIIGAYQDKIILCRYQFPVDPDTLLDDDSAYLENFRKATGNLVFFDPVSGEEEAFYEAGSNDVAGMTQWKNNIYFSAQNNTAILCLDLDTREISTVTDRLPAGKSYVSCEYGALLCTYYDDKEVNAEVTSCSQIDPETGDVTPMKLFTQKPYGPIQILDEIGEYYLVVSDYRYKEEKTWAGTTQIDVQGTVYSLIEKTDYQASEPNYIAIQAVR